MIGFIENIRNKNLFYVCVISLTVMFTGCNSESEYGDTRFIMGYIYDSSFYNNRIIRDEGIKFNNENKILNTIKSVIDGGDVRIIEYNKTGIKSNKIGIKSNKTSTTIILFRKIPNKIIELRQPKEGVAIYLEVDEGFELVYSECKLGQ